jgi:hypothetical protein
MSKKAELEERLSELYAERDLRFTEIRMFEEEIAEIEELLED